MPDLESLVGELRAALSAHPDFSSVAIPDGCAPDAVPPGTPPGYARLLTLTDGPTCGTSLTFWSAAELPGNQYYTQPIEGSELPLHPDEYFCCGLFEPDPLFIRRADGTVWYAPDRDTAWQDSAALAKAADSVEQFFLDKVVGPDYADFVELNESMKDPDGLYDEWYILLKSIGR